MRSELLLSIVACLVTLGSSVVACAPAAPTTPIAGPAEAPSKAESPGDKPTVALPSPTSKPAADQPRYGGILTISTVTDPPSLDSQQESTVSTYMAVAPAYNHILAYDNVTGRELVPELAESWQMSPDGLVYTFKARRDVRFHDGKPMTADDLSYNLRRIIFPPSGIRSNLGYLLTEATRQIEATEADTLKVTLKHPYALFLTCLAVDSGAHIFPKHILEGDQRAMMRSVLGTGPFRFKSYSAGTSIEYVKNQDYWVKDRPYLDGVTFYIIKDKATRLAALRTGRVKRTGTRFAALSPLEVESVKASNLQMRFVPEACVTALSFHMNLRRPPFSDLRVRRAISLVVDRQAALRTLAQGKGLLGRIYAPYEGWGISEEEALRMPGFRQPKDADRAEAKKLLAEAGYLEGFQLTILARLVAGYRDAAEFMSNELSSVGIKSTIQSLEDAQFYSLVREGRHQAHVFTPVNTLPDPYYMSRNYEPGAPSNFSGNDDDTRLMEMSRQEVRTVDITKRKSQVRELERYLLEESLTWFPIVWPYVYFGVWPDVQNMILGVITDAAHNDFQEVWLSR